MTGHADHRADETDGQRGPAREDRARASDAPVWTLVDPGEPVPEGAPGAGDRVAIARSIVNTHALLAAGTGFLPTLGQDMSALLLSQVVQLRRLGRVYGQPVSDDLARTLVLALLSSVTPVKGALPVLAALRLVPGVGHLAGSLLLAATGGCISWATGMVFIQHFESGGTFLSFDPARVRAHFRRELERAVLFRNTRAGPR